MNSCFRIGAQRRTHDAQTEKKNNTDECSMLMFWHALISINVFNVGNAVSFALSSLSLSPSLTDSNLDAPRWTVDMSTKPKPFD